MKHLCLLILFLSFGLSVEADQDLLTSKDVHKIMEQILTYHNNSKEMSQNTLRQGLRIYANQFDPEQIYLIESEVEPLLNPDASTATMELKEYNQNNFIMFSNLNKLIQTSIKRARDWRSQIEKNTSAIFNEYFQTYAKGSSGQFLTNMGDHYAKNTAELDKRMKNHLMRFLDEQRRRYGNKALEQNQVKTLAVYENFMRSYENQYLYQDEQGKLIPPAEQENLFTVHILKALASSLDAHTSFYNANEAYDMKVRLKKSFQGIGVLLSVTKDGVIVNGLVPGGPAEKSGLVKINDVIVEIDGESVADRSFEQVMEMLRNEKNSSINLLLKRAGETSPIKVSLDRQQINVNSDRATYSSEPFGDGIIGEIVLRSFYQGDNDLSAADDVANAITELKKKGNLRGLVLDFRNNSGGFLSQAVKLAGLFITNGVIVIAKYSDGEEKIYRDLDSTDSFDGPLVILVSKMTASAAEIVAQALQDYGVALIVGDEHTFGKGTIQTQTITDGKSSSYFKVTVGNYYTVSGQTPQLRGVIADVIVPGPLNSEPIGEEYLEHTIKPDPKKAPTATYNDTLADVQPLAKSWYMKYYTPTLQHKVTRWKNLVPNLRKNSEYRIANNKNYQLFLKKSKADEDVDEDWPYAEKKVKDFGAGDLQMAEAVNIVKDMIKLDASAQNN